MLVLESPTEDCRLLAVSATVPSGDHILNSFKKFLVASFRIKLVTVYLPPWSFLGLMALSLAISSFRASVWLAASIIQVFETTFPISSEGKFFTPNVCSRDLVIKGDLGAGTRVDAVAALVVF